MIRTIHHSYDISFIPLSIHTIDYQYHVGSSLVVPVTWHIYHKMVTVCSNKKMMSRAGTTSSTPKITAASLTIPATTTSSTPRDSLRPAGCLPGLALPAQHQGSLWPARCLPAVTAGLTPRLSAATDVYQLALLAQHQGSLWPA